MMNNKKILYSAFCVLSMLAIDYGSLDVQASLNSLN
jgi:hypothetical protein